MMTFHENGSMISDHLYPMEPRWLLVIENLGDDLMDRAQALFDTEIFWQALDADGESLATYAKVLILSRSVEEKGSREISNIMLEIADIFLSACWIRYLASQVDGPAREILHGVWEFLRERTFDLDRELLHAQRRRKEIQRAR
jgi:hypothetical protein